MTDVEAGVTALIAEGYDVAASTEAAKAFSVNVTDLEEEGSVTGLKPQGNSADAKKADKTLADYKDTVYVPAVKLFGGTGGGRLNANGIVKDTEGTPRALLVVSVLDENKEQKTLNPDDFVRVGASIVVTAGSDVTKAMANKSIELSANDNPAGNGEVVSFAVKADGTVDQGAYTVTRAVEKSSNVWYLILRTQLKDAAALPVYLDGMKLTAEKNGDYLVEVEPGLSVVAWNEVHETYCLVKDASTINGAATRITPANMKDENTVQMGLSKDGKSIELFTAQKFDTEGTADGKAWKAYSMEDGEYKALESWLWDDGESKNTAGDCAYITAQQLKNGLDLYIVAGKAGIVLGWADTHKVVGELIRNPVGAGKTDDNSTALTGVWKWTADKALKDDSFEVLVSVTMDGSDKDKVANTVVLKEGGSNFGASGITAGKHTVTLDGVTAKSQVDWITAEWAKDVEGMTIDDVKVAKDGKVTLTITVGSEAAVSQGDDEVKVGTINFNLGQNIEFGVEIKVPASGGSGG